MDGYKTFCALQNILCTAKHSVHCKTFCALQNNTNETLQNITGKTF